MCSTNAAIWQRYNNMARIQTHPRISSSFCMFASISARWRSVLIRNIIEMPARTLIPVNTADAICPLKGEEKTVKASQAITLTKTSNGNNQKSISAVLLSLGPV